MRNIIISLTLMILLGGCAGAAATAITDAQDAHDAIKGYVESIHQTRRDIRADCEELLDFCVQEFRDAGDLGGAATVLDAAYPAPVTIELINNVIDKTEGEEINAFTEAHVCKAVAEHCPAAGEEPIKVEIVE